MVTGIMDLEGLGDLGYQGCWGLGGIRGIGV